MKMENYLLAWNPARWVWPELNDKLNNFKNELNVFQQWSVKNKQIKIGDRVFMIRLGVQPKGVFACGIVSEIDITAPHYDPIEANNGTIVNYINFQFEILLDSEKGELINEITLQNHPFDQQHWHIQSSGAHLQSNLAIELYKKLVELTPPECVLPEEITPDITQTYYEGSVKIINVNKYERNRYARNSCIEHYGYNCIVCGFNFEQNFGKLGKDYIHVHHIKPISEIGKDYIVDPIKDLVPVCPNCHAMLHKSNNILTVEELKLIKIN